MPALERAGYTALGVDPQAPAGAHYRQASFEEVELEGSFDAVLACTSLHHVVEPARVVDRVADVLRADGTLVVIEWDWESFDDATAQWSFERLADGEHGWLRRRRDAWESSGKSWGDYLRSWAAEDGVHGWSGLSACLDERFTATHVSYGPYLFADLEGTSPADEQAAIDAGLIRATRVDWVGVPAPEPERMGA